MSCLISTRSGLKFVQEIKIIFKCRDCLEVSRIVICKYKDLTCEFYQEYSFKEKSHFESLTGPVQRNKHVKFTLDLIVYFEYNIIESIVI